MNNSLDKPYDHVIFFHMLKTGGNTLKTIISRNYKPEEVFQVTKKGYQTGPVDYFKSLSIEDRNKIKLFRGHQHFGMHEYFDGETVYFSLVREPISRLMSFYNHINSLPNPYFRDLIPEKERATFGDFLKNIDKYHDQGNNGQAKVLAGEILPEDELLEKVLKNLENHFLFLGLTERFDESLILLKDKLNWGPIYYIKRKVSGKKVTIANISQEELELARSLNQADIQLYNNAKKQFEALVSENQSLINTQIKKLRSLNYIYQKIYNIGSPVKQRFKQYF